MEQRKSSSRPLWEKGSPDCEFLNILQTQSGEPFSQSGRLLLSLCSKAEYSFSKLAFFQRMYFLRMTAASLEETIL